MMRTSFVKPLGVFWPAVALGVVLCCCTPQRISGEEAKRRTSHSQSTFVIDNDEVQVDVTERGGQMAPVTFYRGTAKPIQPYYISLWQDEPQSQMSAPVLVPLRGDFFCLPFGGNAEAVNGEKHPPHGEVAGNKWSSNGIMRVGAVSTLTLTIETRVREGMVTKELSLIDGQNAVYTRHTINGFAGRTPFGHHATLAMPEQEGRFRIMTSAFRFGMTCPSLFGNPREREYQSLLPGARWTNLTKVPAWNKGTVDADLTTSPARYGFSDLVQIFNEPWDKTQGPAWTTATNSKEGYLWYSLKDPDVLVSTVIWIENHGRHGYPWNGRNNCLGLEDVTSHFADGLADSTRENALTREGARTYLELKRGEPFVVNYIQGVVQIPVTFEMVKTLEFSPGKVTFLSVNGERVTAQVRHEFVKTGNL